MDIKDKSSDSGTEEVIKEPSQHVLVLHLNPAAYDRILHVVVQHVLFHHLSVSRDDTETVIKIAANFGLAVIKPVTKDIGESLIQRISGCPLLEAEPNFKIALELM